MIAVRVNKGIKRKFVWWRIDKTDWKRVVKTWGERGMKVYNYTSQ